MSSKQYGYGRLVWYQCIIWVTGWIIESYHKLTRQNEKIGQLRNRTRSSVIGFRNLSGSGLWVYNLNSFFVKMWHRFIVVLDSIDILCETLFGFIGGAKQLIWRLRNTNQVCPLVFYVPLKSLNIHVWNVNCVIMYEMILLQ